MLLSLKVFFYPVFYFARQLAKKKAGGSLKTTADLNFDQVMNKPASQLAERNGKNEF